MKSFIQDRERILDSASDLLKTRVYAENLVKVIENTPKNEVFTIGVFGGWGTGKSSIIRTAQDTIEKKHCDIKFISYDAWKYANDSFRRMFLLKIQQELKMRQTEEMNRFYQSETTEQESKTALSAKGLVICIIVFTLLLALLWLTPLDIEWKIVVTNFVTLLSLIVTLLNGCFYDLKVTISKPALFAPEQFEACFKNMMKKCLKERSWINEQWTKLKDYVETGESSVIGLEKLVIVIDNIDRSPSDMAYQLLTEIKTFLSNEEYNLVFIVPVDDEALKKHLFSKMSKSTVEDINKEKEEFLRKFFNVTLRIKPHQGTELQHFANEINKTNKLGFSNDTLAIVAKEFVDNPRKIIQLLNNLSGDLALYEDNFASKYETVICAALILHEEYPVFYKEATKNLDLIRNFNSEIEINLEGTVKESLQSFMRVTDVFFKQIPLDVLQRILTNTISIFSDLPTHIQKSVTTYDAEKVIGFANNNYDLKTNLVDFTIERLCNEVRYEATTQTSKWIEFLSQLFKANLFDVSRFNVINLTLSNYYIRAIPIIKDLNALCYMGSQMAGAGIVSLRNSIIEYLTSDKAVENVNFKDLLNAYFSNFTSEQDCKDISIVVGNYYLDNQINRDIAFTDIQKKIFFGDSFVTKQIDKISAVNDVGRILDVVWCIKNNNKELSSKTFTALFSKFIELFGDTRGKGKDEYLNFITQLQVIFDAISTQSLTNELADTYGVVTKARAIPNQAWPNNTNQDSHSSILNEIDEEEAKKVTKFCYEITRITGGKVDVSSSISKLYAKCKDSVIQGALKIHKLNITIQPFANTLINVSDYDDENDLKVLEIIMVPKSDGSMMLDEKVIKEKIHSLIDNSGINGVETLLIRLVKYNLILNFVTDYVASLDGKTINKLPSLIARYAVSTFNRENSKIYKDNVDFLILVLKQGSAIQKKEVVRLMKAKINDEVDLDNVVFVLDNLVTEDQQLLKPLVSELEAIKYSETVSDDTRSKIVELIARLSANIQKDSRGNKFLGKKTISHKDKL